MATSAKDLFEGELKKKKICRFCLSQDYAKISNIYMRDTRIKSSAPLPIQIMAIASIEVFSNDGMPHFVCSDCINMFEYSYQFKQMCKKADNLLRQYPLTGVWPACLNKPVFHKPPTDNPVRIQFNSKPVVNSDPSLKPKKILNSANLKAIRTNDTIVDDILPQCDKNTQIITKMEKDSDCTITFLEKIENNVELSIDDIHELMAAEDMNELKEENVEHSIEFSKGDTPKKPKVLNKSSIRILNKDADQVNEPRLSVPKVKQDVNGKTEIFAEILNEDDICEGEPDPKNAVPIETQIYPCTECDRSFPLLQLRDLHMKNHSRHRKFPCEHCEKSFFSKYDLHRHSFVHNGEKPFKCSLCEKGFSRSGLLTRHEKSHTDVPKYICVHCERAFITKSDMERHAATHSIKRPFVCKICKKRFAFKQGLERHETVHSRQQPFSCQYCSESFSTTSKLSRHLTAHAGSRPYPCKFCRKSFLLSHHLTRHMRSHKNADDMAVAISFTCMLCNQSFDSREKLIKHSSTHADELTLQCPMCKDVFVTMTELVTHIEEHSSGEVFACEFCDLIFMSAHKLQTHTDSDHANEMEAYRADDCAQANKHKKIIKSLQNDPDITYEGLQNSVDEFLADDKSVEENNTQYQFLKEQVKSEKDSPEIINQIIINIPTEEKSPEHDVQVGNSLLIPLKQRKLSLTGAKAAITQAETPQEAKPSPQLRRKNPNATGTSVTARDPNQPTIGSILKLPKIESASKTPIANASPTGQRSTKVTIIKTPPTKPLPTRTLPTRTLPTKISSSVPSTLKKSQSKMFLSEKIKTESVPAPKLIKVEKDVIEQSSPPASVDSIAKAPTEKRKGKVQKITVTKAQAAAMAKEGRIRIKDGKIILKN